MEGVEVSVEVSLTDKPVEGILCGCFSEGNSLEHDNEEYHSEIEHINLGGFVPISWISNADGHFRGQVLLGSCLSVNEDTRSAGMAEINHSDRPVFFDDKVVKF
jgi:hypothetical protein